MFVLAHDAAHYRLFQNRTLNDAAGRFIGSITGISMCAYRVVHRLHHNHLYGPQDPDIALHGGYPRGKGYLLRKLATDLAGLTAWKTYKYFFGAPAANATTREAQRPLDDTSPALRRAALRDRWGILAFQVGAPIVVIALFGWTGLLKYAVLWVLPAVTVLQVILRVRAICEHGAPRDHASPLTAARTNLAGPLLRLVLFPHHVNYHIEHHLFPAVPHYNLPRLHEALRARGILENAELRTFVQTWHRVYAPAVQLIEDISPSMDSKRQGPPRRPLSHAVEASDAQLAIGNSAVRNMPPLATMKNNMGMDSATLRRDARKAVRRALPFSSSLA